MLLAPILFSIMLSAMFNETSSDGKDGVEMKYHMDGAQYLAPLCQIHDQRMASAIYCVLLTVLLMKAPAEEEIMMMMIYLIIVIVILHSAIMAG